MKILAVDTSTEACSVALLVNDTLLERFEIKPRAHTQLLLIMIDDLIKEAQIELKEIDAFAFGQGPGSFTGLRISAALIQAFSFGLQKPVIPVSTLRTLAQGALREQGIEKVYAWLDARLNEVYCGLFSIDEKGIMQPQSKEFLLPSLQDPSIFDSIHSQEDYLKEDHSKENLWVRWTGFPRAQDIIRIAASEYEMGRTVSAYEVQPVYLRNKVV